MSEIPKPALVTRPRLSAWEPDHRSHFAVNRTCLRPGSLVPVIAARVYRMAGIPWTWVVHGPTGMSDPRTGTATSREEGQRLADDAAVELGWDLGGTP